jgi:hypothetical protein
MVAIGFACGAIGCGLWTESPAQDCMEASTGLDMDCLAALLAGCLEDDGG